MKIRLPRPRPGLLVRLSRKLRASLTLLLTLLLLAGALRLLLRPDPLDQLRAAQRLFAAGRLHEALALAQQRYDAGDRRPELLLVLAEARLVRGELSRAEQLLALALSGGLSARQQPQAQLDYGWLLGLYGRPADAWQVWAQLPPEWQGQAALLRAELALRSGDTTTARQAAGAALAAPLPAAWHSLAAYRLALLQLGSDPQAASAALAAGTPAPGAIWSMPPLGNWPAGLWARRLDTLRAALDAPQPERLLTSSSLLAEEGLTAAALSNLERGGAPAPGQRLAVLAATLRWRQGDLAGASAQLEQVSAHDPYSAPLLRMLALLQAEQQLPQASDSLAWAELLDPIAPDNAVVRAALARAARDYELAAQAYDEAIALAGPERQPIYHLHAARFYYETTWRQCDAGLSHARAAAPLLDDHESLRLLGELLLRCQQLEEALTTSAALLRRWPEDPAGYYLRGAALLGLGREDEGRAALLQAADLAPASAWRTRAEQLLSN